MTVLQLGPFPPPHGGVQTNLVAIREHLRRHGISAPVINVTRHRRKSGDEVYYPRTALQVVSLVFSLPADVIHLHIGGQLTARLLALCLVCSLVPGRRVVLTFHSGGYPSWTGGNPRKWSVRGIVLRRLDAIIAVNAEIAELLQRLGVSPARLRIICPYAPVSVRDDVVLQEPLPRFCAVHQPLLTTVGLLEPEYDLALQIEALRTIRRSFPDAGLVIIGSGSLEDELRGIIDAHPDREHVLLCGDVPHAETIRIISQSDVFLRTTHYDGDSVSVREALQLGVSVIATDNGMRPAGVRLIPRSDAAALSRAVSAALRDRNERIAPSVTDETPLDQVLDLYSGLLGRDVRLGQPPLQSVS